MTNATTTYIGATSAGNLCGEVTSLVISTKNMLGHLICISSYVRPFSLNWKNPRAYRTPVEDQGLLKLKALKRGLGLNFWKHTVVQKCLLGKVVTSFDIF